MFEFLIIVFLISLVWKGFIPAVINTLAVLAFMLLLMLFYYSFGLWAVILTIILVGVAAYSESKQVN
jgi:hypothetical protein